MLKNVMILLTFLLFASSIALAQNGTVEGRVVDENGNPLPGATIVLVNENIGANSGADGNFTIKNVPVGKQEFICSYVGYKTSTKKVEVAENKSSKINFTLIETSIMSRAISVVASRAEFRETPVAFADVPKQEMELKLGSRDLPLILNETPGVYATQSGGGAGDARINIRGFDQRNVNVMINGVPVNDMENGWVYWSNWDGLGDVTSSIQVQRGLGAGKMANPSVGGTMNIITDPAKQKPGVKIKQEIGNDAFIKTTLVGNTGDMGGFAVSAAGVKKTGDGIVDKTWSDAWAYYLGLRWNASDDHQFEFYLIGAPQEHGQRSYKQSIATFDSEYAKDNGVPSEVADNGKNYGILYNSNWGNINWGDKKTKDYYNGSEHETRFSDILMERENYYHKPQMNLNWYWQINPKLSLTNVMYLSIGRGGGSGPAGSIPLDENGQVDFTSAYNTNTTTIDDKYSTSETKSTAILRNSVNQHFWVGWLGTADAKINSNFRFQGGLDVRYYEGAHWQEVRNLLGGDYYLNTSDKTLDYTANPSLAMKRLGDKYSYHNDGLVQWTGGFAQGEYTNDDLSAYLNLSLSQTSYKRVDYFRTPDMPNGRETDWQNFIGYTFKTGLNYNINDYLNAYVNAGYYSRAPLFRNVFYYDNSIYDNTKNEKVLALETGTGYYSDKFQANLNLYYTKWDDRSWYTSSYITNEDNSRTYFNYNLPGLNALHMGAELDLAYSPIDLLKLHATISLGDWTWANDVTASFSPEDQDTTFITNVYADGLKVGDAAQKTFSLGASLYPVDGLTFNAVYKYYADYYSSFDPIRRTNPDDKEQSWKIPNYGQLDAHLYYNLPLDLPIDITIFGHGFNLLDTKYITDATDGKDHNAETASVYFGFPLTFNFGVQIAY
jgi:iron complex outermembrane recepter protein